MALTIVSGASTDQWTIDPTSKAGRVTLYDSAGNPIIANYLGRYISPIAQRMTGTPVANIMIHQLQNSNGTRTVVVNRLNVSMFFDGVSTDSLFTIEIGKATGMTLITGDTTAVIKRTAQGAPVSGIVRNTFGGTVTGTFVKFAQFSASRISPGVGQPMGITNYDLYDQAMLSNEIELNNLEGLVIRYGSNGGIAGDNLQGFIEWEEK